MNPFVYHTPETQEEVLVLLHEHGDNAKLTAGGTALVIMMKQRLVVPETLISLHRLRGLTAVQETDGTLQLGALLTHRAAETAPLVRTHLPVLAETYHRVATVRIRNVATVGGALAHADPNQDPPVTLLRSEEKVHLASVGGTLPVPIADFYTE